MRVHREGKLLKIKLEAWLCRFKLILSIVLQRNQYVLTICVNEKIISNYLISADLNRGKMVNQMLYCCIRADTMVVFWTSLSSFLQ